MDRVEQVGVIPRELASSLGLLHHGFAPLSDSHSLSLIESSIDFAARHEVESDPRFKQIIPYGVVLKEGRVFVMERLEGSGEKRLMGKVSLGVGGHINPVDAGSARTREDALTGGSAKTPGAAVLTAGGLIESSFKRELAEELVISGVENIGPCGIINDDTQAVGAVHLGVVYRVDLSGQGEALVRETDTLAGDFLPWSAVGALRERMETWSCFVLEAHISGLLGP